MSLFGVPQRTLRQYLTPPHLIGQVTATWRTLVIGGQAFGAAASGLLASAIGIRPTLLVATAGMLLGVLIALLSPLRSFHTLPADPSSRRSMARE